MIRTRAYIDGFNLYHGLIQKSRTHWLDLSKFVQRLNWGLSIEEIVYCTAMVSGRSNDSGKADRQDGYLRALAIACPNVEVVFGNFSTNKKSYPLASCPNDPTCAIRVSVRTEKGSDVNLATRLLHDAHMQRFDRAIVISGDSDLVEPIRLVTRELNKTVWVRNPRNVASKELAAVASDYDGIRPSLAINSQLPNPVTDGLKSYSKPSRWDQPLEQMKKSEISRWSCSQGDCQKCFSAFRYEKSE